jgi:hypothetical protein
VSPRLSLFAPLLLSAALPCGGIPVRVDTPLGDANQLAAKSEEINKKKAECDKLKGKEIVYEEERSIGGAVAVHFLGKNGLVELPAEPVDTLKKKTTFDPPKGDKAKYDLNLYVNRVGQKVADHSDRPALPWTFGVIKNDKDMNAYSAPGGYVLITTGLLKACDNEAQLAGILAHEVTHVVEKHALKAYSEMKVDECKSAVTKGLAGDIAGSMIKLDFGISTPSGYVNLDGAVKEGGKKAVEFVVGYLGKGVSAITSAGYSKNDVFVADVSAERLMIASGYDPDELPKIIAKIPEGGGLMAAHAKNSERIDKVKQARSNMYETDPKKFGYVEQKWETKPIPGEVKAAM